MVRIHQKPDTDLGYEKGTDPLRGRVEVLKRLKSRRVPGVGVLPTESIRGAGENIITILCNLCYEIWREEIDRQTGAQ